MAITCFSYACGHKPNDASALYHLGESLRCAHRYYDAIPHLNNVIKLAPDYAKGYVALGQNLYSLNKIDMAITLMERACILEPENIDIYSYLGTYHDSIGNKEKSHYYFNKGFTIDPNNARLQYTYAFHNKKNISDAQISLAVSAIQNKKNPVIDRTHFAYAAAFAYESRKEWDLAFDHYQLANTLLAESHQYTGGDVKRLNYIRKLYTPELAEKLSGGGYATNQPIFIVGMPRSGTTLTGQILACHNNVQMAGELSILANMIRRPLPKLTGYSYPEALLHLTPEHVSNLGGLYAETLKMHGDAARIIDKMPANLMHIGLIKAILPDAKIIYCTRHPVDIAWSIWRQNFGMHHYRYRFDTLAAMIAAVQKLMAHWNALYPDSIYTSTYESLLDNPEGEIRNLLNYCELPWQDACLNFHESSSHIRTASINQVRQPLYKSAMNSWDPVKHRLQPLFDAFAAEGITY